LLAAEAGVLTRLASAIFCVMKLHSGNFLLYPANLCPLCVWGELAGAFAKGMRRIQLAEVAK
jgi:hypothetical protein